MRFSDFGPLEIVNYEDFLERSRDYFNSEWKKIRCYEEKLGDFETVELLGHGTFGKVVLVKNKLSQRHRYHAMKIIDKSNIVAKKQVENTRTEKNLMQCMIHPMIIRLDYFFQDNSYLYLIMPHIPGGDLFRYVRRFGKFEELQSQFYSAQVILAIEYLHYLNFVHRDLKPENILIDHMGYLKLSDLGFCKRLQKGRTYTLCGTPEYMAPELLKHKGYGFAVDWWSIGILIYELNTGYSPFYSRNVTKVYKKILSNSYKMPPHFSEELKDIVDNLLQEDISKRYGNLKAGVGDVKGHMWFRSMNWLALLSRKIQAPYKPLLKKPGLKKSSKEMLESFNLTLQVSDENKYKDLFSDF